MSSFWHKVYISTMVLIVLIALVYLSCIGYSYYQLPLEERFYHPKHDWFKPSGLYGHGLGIVGTFLIFFGVSIYIARKRFNFMTKYLRLKYLLEFHIFLCVIGPLFIVFHTAFKFGGIVSIAFWCMVAVVASGVVGRFIYIQIPRTIEGRELGINELKLMRVELSRSILNSEGMDEEAYKSISDSIKELLKDRSFFGVGFLKKRSLIYKIKKALRSKSVSREEIGKILVNIKSEISLVSKIERLNQMQKLFKYWHVAHLPFALIMLIIVILHVVVTLAFGYKWIF